MDIIGLPWMKSAAELTANRQSLSKLSYLLGWLLGGRLKLPLKLEFDW
jgi:hypothetical protein